MSEAKERVITHHLYKPSLCTLCVELSRIESMGTPHHTHHPSPLRPHGGSPHPPFPSLSAVTTATATAATAAACCMFSLPLRVSPGHRQGGEGDPGQGLRNGWLPQLLQRWQSFKSHDMSHADTTTSLHSHCHYHHGDGFWIPALLTQPRVWPPPSRGRQGQSSLSETQRVALCTLTLCSSHMAHLYTASTSSTSDLSSSSFSQPGVLTEAECNWHWHESV